MSKKILSILCLVFMGLCCILAGIMLGLGGNFDFSKQKHFNKTFRTQVNIRVNNLTTISKYSAKAQSENLHKINARSDLGNINITGSVE